MNLNTMCCAVRSCLNTSKKTSSKIKYFRFPIEDEIRSIWIVRCDRRDSWNPSASFICSSHFTTYDYEMIAPGVHRLRADAIPSRNLRVFDWDLSDQLGTGTDEPFSEEDDHVITSIMKARKTVKTESILENYLLTSSLAQQSTDSCNPHHPSASTHSMSDTDGGNMSSDTSRLRSNEEIPTKKKKVSKNAVPSSSEGPKKLRKKKKSSPYCVVPTCSASRAAGCHNFPKDPSLALKWLRAIFHGEASYLSVSRRNRVICRRHFTEDDYLDPPKSGQPARLRRGAVPSVNLPVCRAEVRLAQKKLYFDIMRRKPEEKNLTFHERLVREPELMTLYQKYLEEVKEINPSWADTLPTIPRRGELKGTGDPSLGDVRGRQIRSEEFLAAKQARDAKKRRRKEYIERKKAFRELKQANTEVYEKMIAEDRADERREKEVEKLEKRRKLQAEKLIRNVQGGDMKFGEKIQIISQDPEKGQKYKVIMKKVLKPHETEQFSANQLAKDQRNCAELFNTVIRRIDVSKGKRIKFSTTNKLTKMAEEAASKKLTTTTAFTQTVSLDSVLKKSPSPKVKKQNVVTEYIEATPIEQPTLQSFLTEEIVAEDAPDDDYGHFEDDQFEEYVTDEMGGDDHCYTSRNLTMRCMTKDEPEVDPFIELQQQLKSLPEAAARDLVKEKMDGYKDTFKKQVAKIRQLMQMKKKTDRKLKTITRVLSSSLRDQYMKYYCS